MCSSLLFPCIADQNSAVTLQLWALPFLACQTAISMIGTMIPLHTRHQCTAPPMFKLSKDSSRIPDNQGVSYCLASLFSTWIKEQWSAEKRMGLHLFMPDEHAYLGDAKKYECVLPSSRQHCPKAEF
jgi:hypothetical protein